MICPGCGTDFEPPHHSCVFCAGSCQQAFADLSAIRGKVMLPLIQTWRAHRKPTTTEARYAFQQLCALADMYNAQDKASGRRPDLLVARKMAAMWCAADLLDRKKIS